MLNLLKKLSRKLEIQVTPSYIRDIFDMICRTNRFLRHFHRASSSSLQFSCFETR